MMAQPGMPRGMPAAQARQAIPAQQMRLMPQRPGMPIGYAVPEGEMQAFMQQQQMMNEQDAWRQQQALQQQQLGLVAGYAPQQQAMKRIASQGPGTPQQQQIYLGPVAENGQPTYVYANGQPAQMTPHMQQQHTITQAQAQAMAQRQAQIQQQRLQLMQQQQLQQQQQSQAQQQQAQQQQQQQQQHQQQQQQHLQQQQQQQQHQQQHQQQQHQQQAQQQAQQQQQQQQHAQAQAQALAQAQAQAQAQQQQQAMAAGASPHPSQISSQMRSQPATPAPNAGSLPRANHMSPQVTPKDARGAAAQRQMQAQRTVHHDGSQPESSQAAQMRKHELKPLRTDVSTLGRGLGGISEENDLEIFHDYIYEYLYRSGLASTARSLLTELRKKSPAQADADPSQSQPQSQATPKQSPRKRSRSEDADDASPLTAIEEDDKAEGKPTDEALPEPKVPIAGEEGGNGFLFEWWTTFWDLHRARLNEAEPQSAAPATAGMSAYLQSAKTGRVNPPQAARPQQMVMNPGQQMVMGQNGQMFVASRELLLQQQQQQQQRLLQQQQQQAMQAGQSEHIAKRARVNGPGAMQAALQQQQQQVVAQQGQMQLQHPHGQLMRVVSQNGQVQQVTAAQAQYSAEQANYARQVIAARSPAVVAGASPIESRPGSVVQETPARTASAQGQTPATMSPEVSKAKKASKKKKESPPRPTSSHSAASPQVQQPAPAAAAAPTQTAAPAQGEQPAMNVDVNMSQFMNADSNEPMSADLMAMLTRFDQPQDEFNQGMEFNPADFTFDQAGDNNFDESFGDVNYANWIHEETDTAEG